MFSKIQLQAAADELNTVLGLKPKIKTDIETPNLTAKVKAAILLLADGDIISAELNSIIKQLDSGNKTNFIIKSEEEVMNEEVPLPEEEQEEEEEEEETNTEEVEEEDPIDEIPAEDELVDSPVEEVPLIDKPNKTPKEPKLPKKPVTPRATYSRAQALLDALKVGGSKKELIYLVDKLYVDNGGKAGLNGAKAMLDLHTPILKLAGVVTEKDGILKLAKIK